MTLDQQIHARIDAGEVEPIIPSEVADWDQLAAAVRGVLAIREWDGVSTWERGWNRARELAVQIIADALGITEEATP